jgi:hypothetical protein
MAQSDYIKRRLLYYIMDNVVNVNGIKFIQDDKSWYFDT